MSVSPTPARRRFLTALGTSALGLMAGCSRAPVTDLGGRTMGTSYAVRVAGTLNERARAALARALRADLGRITALMSLYDPVSELTRWHRSGRNVQPALSEETARVVGQGLALRDHTGGAFDPSIGALVRLWGFHREGTAALRVRQPPPERAVRAALAHTGAAAVQLDLRERTLERSDPAVRLDLNGIAKGRAVDMLAGTLERFGFGSYVVEIGGEVRVHGERSPGDPWRIAIIDPAGGAPHLVFPLHAGAAATSGDYLQYFESGGQRFSHLIDPRSGYPVRHATASVTVLAADTLTADALSTALMVMGATAGLRFAEREGIAAYFIERETNTLRGRATRSFARLAQV